MRKILAIDDQKDNLISIKAIIETHIPNSKVFTVLSGKEGIKTAQEESPDVILLDIIMPKMDGYEVCERLKSNESTKHIPIVMITAIKTDSKSRIKALNCGADAFLSKPIEENELCAQIKVMLRIKESEDKLREEKNQIRNSLIESEEKYKVLYENAPLPYQSLNEDGSFKDVNPAWLSTLGYQRNEVIGKYYKDFLHPDWQAHFETNFPAFKKRGYVHDVNFKIRHKKGHYIDISFEGCIGYHPDGSFKHTYCVFQDITERKKSEEKLLNLYAWQEAIFEGSRDAIFVSNVDSQFIMVNKAACLLTAYTKEELLQMKIPDLHEIQDLEAYSLFHDQIMNGEELLSESRILKKNGQKVQTEFNNSRIKIGDQYYMHTSARDITERKQIEKALIESEEKHRTITETIPGVVYECDMDWTFLFVSSGFKELTGYPVSDIINNNVRSYVSLMFEDDIKRITPSLDESLKRKDQFYFSEYKLKIKSRKVVWVHDSVRILYDMEGKAIGYKGVLLDITKRKKTEKELLIAKEKAEESETKYKNALSQANQFVKILDNMPSHIYIKNKKRQYTYANKICLNLFNKTKESIFGSIDKEFFPPETCKQLREIDKKILENGLSTNEEVPVTLDDGSCINYLEMKFPLYDENGEIKGLCGISTDISELKQTQIDLQEAKEKAEESDRLKSAFLANMSHEIRTPMNGILGFTDLLKEPKLSGKEQEKYIGVIKSCGNRLLNTVNDLIDISKIEADQMQVSVSEVDINKLNEDIFTFFRVEAQKKKLQLSLSRSSQTNDIILSDQEKLYSILTNLIKNAIKFTQKGSIDFGYQKKGNDLQFFVKDTGIGIPKEILETIFDRFIRSGLDDDNYEGSGLGLSISKAYVEMLGGKIWLESEEGVGSQFYFTIPCKTVKSKVSENKEVDTETKSTDTIKNLKILIAEDDIAADDLLSILVRDISKEIIHTKSGVEVVELCRNNPDIDLVLMDILLSEMNGYEATKQIRKFNKDVIIIAQTAYALAGDREKSIEAGCNEYISKPINKEELFEKIEKCLGKD